MWLGQQGTSSCMLPHHLYPNSNWFRQFYQKPEKKINKESYDATKINDVQLHIILPTHTHW
jgi:hypothetical protein